MKRYLRLIAYFVGMILWSITKQTPYESIGEMTVLMSFMFGIVHAFDQINRPPSIGDCQ